MDGENTFPDAHRTATLKNGILGAGLDGATPSTSTKKCRAGLAILVWHLYLVVFDLDVYPMGPAWLTGKSPRKEPPESKGAARA